MINHYDANYADFQGELYREVRRDAFGEDIGQNSWMTAAEQDALLPWLNLGPGKRLLDVGCGAGGPALRISSISGCSVMGIDTNASAIRAAQARAHNTGLVARAEFCAADAKSTTSVAAESLDAITCIDAINHFPDREDVVAEWGRLLKPGGRLLFTDPLVMTGPVTSEEFAARTPSGFYIMAPEGYDEAVLIRSGLRLLHREDLTVNMAKTAESRMKARERRQAALSLAEGGEAFESQQTFLRMVARLATEKRLSRIAFVAQK
jgi:ubiquinone/menaquinone biosynthesis C-methylase UbiE